MTEQQIEELKELNDEYAVNREKLRTVIGALESNLNEMERVYSYISQGEEDFMLALFRHNEVFLNIARDYATEIDTKKALNSTSQSSVERNTGTHKE